MSGLPDSKTSRISLAARLSMRLYCFIESRWPRGCGLPVGANGSHGNAKRKGSGAGGGGGGDGSGKRAAGDQLVRTCFRSETEIRDCAERNVGGGDGDGDAAGCSDDHVGIEVLAAWVGGDVDSVHLRDAQVWGW